MESQLETRQGAPAAHKAAGSEHQETLLQQIAHTYHDLVAAFERHMGITRARWAILSRLWREETATQTLLAQRLRVDAAAITRQVKQLEREGLVVRWPDPQDNRFTVVSLTPSGRRFVEELRSARDAFEAVVTAGLSEDDVAAMRRSLDRIRENLRTLA